MSKAKKQACIGKDCVACGCCVKACPFQAVSILKGIIAVVEQSKCVGCGKCRLACPAGVIEIVEKGAAAA